MLRSLLALLAVLVPGLAFLFERPWLYVATGLIIVGGLGLVGWWLWTTVMNEDTDPPRPSPDSEDSEPDLEEMGIVDIKPEDEASSQSDAPQSDAVGNEENGGAEEPRAPTSSPTDSPTPATHAPSSPQQDQSSAPASGKTDARAAPILAPLLESLRAAIDARTVCLLIQEDVALTYRIEAIASTHSSVRSGGTFDTQTPLLTATMSRESVTLRSLAEEKVAVEDLQYYDDPPAVTHLAAAPISRPDTSSTTFLLADGPEDVDLGNSEARSLLEHFADAVALLYSVDPTASSDSEPASTEEHTNGQHSGAETPSKGTGASAHDDRSPRPRREIIAEEIETARTADDELALALVHLNRAESIARQGDEAVASAERLLHARLDQLAPDQRIERFGELTYGIFFRKGPDAVESRVADLETTMAREEEELEGGVSVGVAVWGGHDDNPEALRTEATEALREAYETGTSTIVT